MERRWSIKNIFRLKEDPLSWEKWEKMVLSHKYSGIPLGSEPSSFTMTDSFMKTFDAMLPVKDGRVDKGIKSEQVDRAMANLEVGHSITVSRNNHFFIHTENLGRTGPTKNGGAYVNWDRPLGEIGSIHTHPYDILPSSIDVLHPILGSSINIVVTPKRVVTLFRSTDTPYIPLLPAAEGFMDEMAKRKKKRYSICKPIENEDYFKNEKLIWTPNYDDLSELKILGYEAPRSKNIFVRKTE